MHRQGSLDALETPLRVAIVSRTQYFDEYRAALVRIFKQLGCEAEAFEDVDYSYEPDCFLIVNPFHFTKEKKYHRSHIFGAIQTEQIPSYLVGSHTYASRYIRRIWRIYRQYDFLIEWSRASYQILSKSHANIFFLPHGSFTEIEYTRQLSAQEQYDLCFIGDPSGIQDRRKNILDALSKRYKMFPKSTNLWGVERQQAILNSRIVLNIHYEQSLVFESPRFYECLANRCFLLSEPVHDSFPFEEEEDYATFQMFNVLDKVNHYLANADERARIAEAGHVKAIKYRLDRLAGRILQRIVLEKYQRRGGRYRMRDRLFHLTGIDWLKRATLF